MQLFPVPKAIIQRERHLLHTVAHLPPCSFPTAAFRSLASVGLPSFRLLQPLSEAIRWRTATSTIRDSWQVHHYRLTAIRRNKGPFCNLVSTESSDVGWLGPAIVDLLHDSEQTGIVARGGRVDERSRQQDVAYKFACERLPVFDWVQLLLMRIPRHFGVTPNPAVLGETIKVWGQQPCVNSWHTLVTWLNAWHTTHRMHEHFQLPCIFGCGGTDDPRHYFECTRLRAVLNIHFAFFTI